MSKTNISSIKPGQNNFPERLVHLAQVPEELYVVGEDLKTITSNKVVGIIGSRKFTPYGQRATRYFASELAKRGVVIVSGLALGIDSIAHRACLESRGKTIAVLPSGIEKIYPASHRGLARSIVIKDGSVVSEYSGQQQPMRHNFIERNRIIAALSDILLVTEAAQNSGSLHTAQFALELGRTVYAVPGPIDSPTSQGTNNLIKSGATPATSPDDILEELGLANQTVEYLPEDEEESKILKLIKEGCLEGGMLLALSELKPEIFQQKLTILEIKGVIASVGNNNWSLK